MPDEPTRPYTDTERLDWIAAHPADCRRWRGSAGVNWEITRPYDNTVRGEGPTLRDAIDEAMRRESGA